MKKDWSLTQDMFDKLLAWLDSDRDEAGRKYEAIRLRVIKIFTCRGCWNAEELADEIINRVAVKVMDPAFEYQGNQALYFYGFVPNLEHEDRRKSNLRAADISPEDASHVSCVEIQTGDDAEPEFECLDRCLDKLPNDNRKLVIEYYQHDRSEKIDHRKRLATEFGIAVNALRIRAHRIRRALETCVRDCVEQQPAH